MKGGCLCGAVRYETRVAPTYSGFCHCRDCQKATGTGHCCYMIFDKGDVVVTGTTRSFAIFSNSGRETTRRFCETCGSQIFGGGAPEDPRLSIYAGTLDDPEEFRPSDAVFVRSRRHWDHVTLELNEHETLPP